MAPLKLVLDIKKRRVREKRGNNISLLISAMIGEYTLEHLAYDLYHRGLKLVELFEDLSAY